MKIEIVIDEEGNVTIDEKDTVGPGCTAIGDALANVLGQKQTQDLKQEYYEVPLPDFQPVNE